MFAVLVVYPTIMSRSRTTSSCVLVVFLCCVLGSSSFFCAKVDVKFVLDRDLMGDRNTFGVYPNIQRCSREVMIEHALTLKIGETTQKIQLATEAGLKKRARKKPKHGANSTPTSSYRPGTYQFDYDHGLLHHLQRKLQRLRNKRLKRRGEFPGARTNWHPPMRADFTGKALPAHPTQVFSFFV